MVYIITGENENILLAFGLGINGLLLLAVMRIIQRIVKLFKYHIGKRSIFEEEISGRRFKCKTSNTNDIHWASEYKLIKRYATKTEWTNIPDFSKAFIEKSKRNCERCKYNKVCDDEYLESIKCKHDEYGKVLEFDKFEKK